MQGIILAKLTGAREFGGLPSPYYAVDGNAQIMVMHISSVDAYCCSIQFFIVAQHLTQATLQTMVTVVTLIVRPKLVTTPGTDHECQLRLCLQDVQLRGSTEEACHRAQLQTENEHAGSVGHR